jgi:DNA-binding beta-propeller fold protein YncE
MGNTEICELRRRLTGLLGILPLLVVFPAAADQPAPTSAGRTVAWGDRSPVDLVLAPDESWLVTANQTSSTISLVRVSDGMVLDEQQVAERPEVIVLAPDGRTILVSCSHGGVIERFLVGEGSLRRETPIETGCHPHGIALRKDGRTAYVALCAADEIGVVDLEASRIVARIPVGRWPRYLALSPDERRLAVGTSGDRGITVVDTEQQQSLFTQAFMGLNIGHLQASRDNQFVYFPWMVYRHNPVTPRNIQLGWVLASRVARVRLDELVRREALSLDPAGKAVADPFGLALTSDESRMVVSASGTKELLDLRLTDMPLQDFGGTDHLPPALRDDPERFDRIPLGGRPMGIRLAADDNTVYVANYLRNSVQVVSLSAKGVIHEIPLGSAAEPSLARAGEAIFYDATRSLDQWYSCHSCHYNGGINSERMDTDNDGSRFTFKTVLPLYHLTETGPWTWHGWQEDLGDAMRKSITSTMQGPEPPEEDVAALLAFFANLSAPPNPFLAESGGRLSPAAERGQAIFAGHAGCIQCHHGPHFTDGQLHDVGLGTSEDRYPKFNTPTLIGVYKKTHLLHDGRARTLDELLEGPHDPARVAGERSLTDQERQDLIEYLKTL